LTPEEGAGEATCGCRLSTAAMVEIVAGSWSMPEDGSV